MTLNWLGVVADADTFFGIWLGPVSNRKVAAALPSLWLQTTAALACGLVLEIAARLSANRFLSATREIVGMTLLWNAVEYWRQQKRVAHAHAPSNLQQPRHTRLLATSKSATPINWLDREPLERPVTLDAIWPRRESAP